jgi:PilZ domain
MGQTPAPFDTERRSAHRYHVNIPIDFDGGSGTTHDVSERGIRFVTTAACALGQPIRFVLRFIRLEVGEARWRIGGTGSVVRIHSDGDQSVVAIAVDGYSFPIL